MKTPKTIKAYLKMLIVISEDSVYDLKGMVSDGDEMFIGSIRASIQNLLGEDEFGTMKKNNLKYNG